MDRQGGKSVCLFQNISPLQLVASTVFNPPSACLQRRCLLFWKWGDLTGQFLPAMLICPASETQPGHVREAGLVDPINNIPAPRILEFHWRNFSPPRGWSANMQRLVVISSSGSPDPSVGKMTDRTNWEELRIFHVVKWHINCRLQNAIIFTVKTLI